MAKLNQIIAIEKGTKTRVHNHFSDLYKVVQKQDLFNGFTKSYAPIDESGETLPPENKKVVVSANQVLDDITDYLTESFNITARKDFTNCVAKADVIVKGTTLLTQVPVTYLLFLEKAVTDIKTFINAIPVLDEADNWTQDPNSGLFKTETTKTHRTKKVQRPIVLYVATDKHPAQTQLITEDILAGYWSQQKHSGALPKPEKKKLLEKVEALLDAVKEAREQANAVDEIPTTDVGGAVFNYLLS